jgi:diketogulonate reductase-like aldo/keto reductase
MMEHQYQWSVAKPKSPIETSSLTDFQIGYGTGTAMSKRNKPAGLDRSTIDALLMALKEGIRHIDGAQGYGNEEEIGIAIKESGIPREELFITTKVGEVSTLPGSIDESLKKLGLDYVDLFVDPCIITKCKGAQY